MNKRIPRSEVLRGVRVIVLTISDSCQQKTRVDLSGPRLVDQLRLCGAQVIGTEILSDDRRRIAARLRHGCDKVGADLIVTTGGTGLGPRDVTPEATLDVIDKDASGIVEYARRRAEIRTPFAVLSRGVAGVRKSTLIVNFPGSPGGAGESLSYSLVVLAHALKMIRGCGHPDGGQIGRGE